MILSRELILQQKDLKTEIVDVPEWGVGAQVIVSEMGAADTVSWNDFVFVGEGDERKVDAEHLYAKAAVRCIVDESGNRLFPDADYLTLKLKSYAAIERIGEAALRLNVLSRKSQDVVTKN